MLGENCWEHLEKFLRREGIKQDNKDLIEFLSEREVQEYRFITKRVLDFSQWLKRVAEGEIEDEGKGRLKNFYLRLIIPHCFLTSFWF
jgi:CRISPR/Cas system CMR-associated protein Cmr5 small subunit